ncbi:hypothetical protein OPV22_022250 [Ensete ventricosum]|uniref:Uncharacterized protein n=1 Tax=Ensete ventricosum TaxID=4639 RepID=A0AAV8QPH6_ENSVE|nr:hypothetical protein OPV22_022250 [Ensete ventricosum]
MGHRNGLGVRRDYTRIVYGSIYDVGGDKGRKRRDCLLYYIYYYYSKRCVEREPGPTCAEEGAFTRLWALEYCLIACSGYFEIDVKFQLSSSQVLLVAIWILGASLRQCPHRSGP